MKKILISTLGLFACASAFAEISDNAYGGKLITGDYTASELVQANGGSSEFGNFTLDGANITITDATDIYASTPAAMTGNGTMTLRVVKGGEASSLSLASGSTGSYKFASTISSQSASLTINIDENAGGYLYAERILTQSSPITLNLGKDYAIRTSDENKTIDVAITDSWDMYINSSGDISVELDIRSNATMHLNLTNGARFYLEGLTKIQKNNSTANIFIQNSLENGAILFNKDMFVSGYEYDEELASYKIVVKKGANTETILFSAIEGVDLSQLVWSDTLVDGYWALYGVSAVPEPAEWAMIFGALALGLAVYKRRK
ncbi:MAG: hypothetical protein E7036_06620 [Opitutales bacterium]|nr:hypothetical protein [Opitutales bacterium]